MWAAGFAAVANEGNTLHQGSLFGLCIYFFSGVFILYVSVM